MSKISLHKFLSQFVKSAAIANLAAVEEYLRFAGHGNNGKPFEVPLANGQKVEVDRVALLPDIIPLFKSMEMETEVDFVPLQDDSEVEEDADYNDADYNLSSLNIAVSKGLFKRYSTVKLRAVVEFSDTVEALQIVKDRANAIHHGLASEVQPKSNTEK